MLFLITQKFNQINATNVAIYHFHNILTNNLFVDLEDFVDCKIERKLQNYNGIYETSLNLHQKNKIKEKSHGTIEMRVK